MITPRHLSRSLYAAVLSLSATNMSDSAGGSDGMRPPLRTESTTEIGREMLHQGQLYQRAAIHLSQEIKFGQQGVYALTPGYYVRTGERIGWETYAPADSPEAGRVKKAPGAITLQGSFHYSNDGQTIGVITNFYQAVNAKALGVTRTTRPAWSRDHLQRSLVYGGKSGTQIKLCYREIWKNITRPAGDLHVKFDLAVSKVVKFRGARIEVMEATDKRIRYRVTQAFDSTEK